MAGFNLKLLLNMLKETTGGEVNQQSLCHFLLLNEATSKRLFNGKTPWPKGKPWRDNAHEIVDEYEEKYEKERKAILGNRLRIQLTQAEGKQLAEIEKAFMQRLHTEYKSTGIHNLEDCCYVPDADTVFSFEGRLTDLVESVLANAERYWGTSGKKAVLRYLRGCGGFEDDIEKLNSMDEDDYPDMARFLVQRAKSSGTTNGKEPPSEKRVVSDGVRLLRYEDLKELGLTAWDIAQNLVENDYLVYPDIAPENEANAGLWKEYLSRYPDTFAYLVDQNKRIVGNWSFVSITEEQERAMEAGELMEDTFNVQNTECLFLPGDYILYLLNLSCNEGFAKPQYYQILIDELWKQMLAYARDGIYFKRFCINVFHPVYEALWRSMGFQFITENRFSGRVYALSLIPFPSTLKAKDQTMFLELKEIYDEHFAV